MPWDKVAKELSDTATGGAIEQHIAKIRKKRLELGLEIIPKAQRFSRKRVGGGGEAQTPTKKPAPSSKKRSAPNFSTTPTTPRKNKRRAATKSKYIEKEEDDSRAASNDPDSASDMDGEYGVPPASGKKRSLHTVIKDEPLDEEPLSPKKLKTAGSDSDNMKDEVGSERETDGEFDTAAEGDTAIVNESPSAASLDGESLIVPLQIAPTLLNNFAMGQQQQQPAHDLGLYQHLNVTQPMAIGTTFGYGQINAGQFPAFNNVVPGFIPYFEPLNSFNAFSLDNTMMGTMPEDLSTTFGIGTGMQSSSLYGTSDSSNSSHYSSFDGNGAFSGTTYALPSYGDNPFSFVTNAGTFPHIDNDISMNVRGLDATTPGMPIQHHGAFAEDFDVLQFETADF